MVGLGAISWREFERKGSWPNFRYSTDFCRGTEVKYKKKTDSVIAIVTRVRAALLGVPTPTQAKDFFLLQIGHSNVGALQTKYSVPGLLPRGKAAKTRC